ncbi:MAG: hypothetical protein WCV91_05820 [Candidatus Margulisiibacteriota bacterium]
MIKWLAFAAATFFLCFPLQAEVKPFVEFWNQGAYYATNVERNNFSSLLGRYEGKVGINPFESQILQVYGVYYGTASQSNDYWDNSLYYGLGVRSKPFEKYIGKGWADEWFRDVRYFMETLAPIYFKDAISGEANKRFDNRYGLDLWHEWNLDNPDYNNYWGEVWSNLSYRATNFGYDDFNGYLFYFQPKVGRHLGRGIEPYVKIDYTTSTKNDYWLNMANYGAGIRFEPWRATEKRDDFLLKFKMFAEILKVNYLKDVPSDPNKVITKDVKFGVEFSMGR